MRTLLLLRYDAFAIYLAADGEINTVPIIAKLWEYSKTLALPVLRHSDYSAPAPALQMQFALYSKDGALTRGAYNLDEPATQKGEPEIADRPFTPQLIFLPLVAFDRNGTRLGMGGGFYDRYTVRPRHKNTLRIGLAHSIQEAKSPLPKEPWDQPLDAVISESQTLAFNDRAAALLGTEYTK